MQLRQYITPSMTCKVLFKMQPMNDGIIGVYKQLKSMSNKPFISPPVLPIN